jgi:hypothetical protein
MIDRPTIVERAFDLAKSGRVTRLGELRSVLRAEGYIDQGQLSGRSIRDQLVNLIADAKGQTKG